MKKKWYVILIVVFLVCVPLNIFSQDELTKSLYFDGNQYQIIVEVTGETSDVFLVNGIKKNLSKDFPGENLFPAINTFDGNFFVTWNHYQDFKPHLCIYDFTKDESRRLEMGDFKFISAPKLDWDGYALKSVFFLGNESNNDDIYLYDMGTRKLINITQTTLSEKNFNITVKDDTYIIDAFTLYQKIQYVIDRNTYKVLSMQVVEELRERIGLKTLPLTQNFPPSYYRTFIAFGDSITWGKIRMTYLEGFYHPELAYPQKVKEILEMDLGKEFFAINLGVAADSTLDGVNRINQALKENSGYFFLLMLGTNDTYRNEFSLNSSLENLEYIINAALNKHMKVVVSTIPPRKDRFFTPTVVKNIKDYNDGVIALAGERHIKHIDTYGTFMTFNPPDGWKSLLEDIINGVGGNHPSPLGHEKMANFFSTEIKHYPPSMPVNIVTLEKSFAKSVIQWSQNYEPDFSHYVIEYGYSVDRLNRTATTSGTSFTFVSFPFHTPFYDKIYFHIQAVDLNGNTSDFTPLYVIELNQPQGNLLKVDSVLDNSQIF